MITTTLNKIRSCSPCEQGWIKLLKHLGKTQADDEPVPFSVIVESNGLDDALWCCRTVEGYDKEWRLFAVWCARQVQHLMKDQRSIDALDVAERYANGEATLAELDAAWDAARRAERCDAIDISDTTLTELDAAWDAAWRAKRCAARDAANAAWKAIRCDSKGAADTATDATDGDAARSSARDAQKTEFLRIVGEKK